VYTYGSGQPYSLGLVFAYRCVQVQDRRVLTTPGIAMTPKHDAIAV